MKNRTEIQDVQHDRYQLLKCKHIQRHREEKCKPRASTQKRSYEVQAVLSQHSMVQRQGRKHKRHRRYSGVFIAHIWCFHCWF